MCVEGESRALSPPRGLSVHLCVVYNGGTARFIARLSDTMFLWMYGGVMREIETLVHFLKRLFDGIFGEKL